MVNTGNIDLGFGGIEGCLAGVGIHCEECRHYDACMEEDEELSYLEALSS